MAPQTSPELERMSLNVGHSGRGGASCEAALFTEEAEGAPGTAAALRGSGRHGFHHRCPFVQQEGAGLSGS